MVNAENDSGTSNKSGGSPERTLGSETAVQEGDVAAGTAASSDGVDIKSSKADLSNPSSSAVNKGSHTRAVLLCLPQTELQLLCSLLAREGYVECCNSDSFHCS